MCKPPRPSLSLSLSVVQWVLSVDLFANEDADANVVISETQSWTVQGDEVCTTPTSTVALCVCVCVCVQVVEKVQAAVGEEKLDAVVCVAGGWAGGNAASPGIMLLTIPHHVCALLCTHTLYSSADLVKNCDLMWKQSVWTSVLAAQISSKHLRE